MVLVYRTLLFIEIFAVKLNSSGSYVTFTHAFCFQVSNKILEQQPQTPPPHWQGPCFVAVTWVVVFDVEFVTCFSNSCNFFVFQSSSFFLESPFFVTVNMSLSMDVSNVLSKSEALLLIRCKELWMQRTAKKSSKQAALISRP